MDTLELAYPASQCSLKDRNIHQNSILYQTPCSLSTRYLTTWKSAALFSPCHTCPVAFWSLSVLEHLQGPHHQQHIRCLSRVWSGTTLRRASVQLSKPSDATYSSRPLGQRSHGRRLPQPGQLIIRGELLGYQNNNNRNIHFHAYVCKCTYYGTTII